MNNGPNSHERQLCASYVLIAPTNESGFPPEQIFFLRHDVEFQKLTLKSKGFQEFEQVESARQICSQIFKIPWNVNYYM